MLANIHIIWLAEEELCAVDSFVFETQKDECRELLKRPVYISPSCMEKMKTDTYLHWDETETVWSAEEVVLRGIKYPPMSYVLRHCPDNWTQVISINYDNSPCYTVDESIANSKCVIICIKGETPPSFIAT